MVLEPVSILGLMSGASLTNLLEQLRIYYLACGSNFKSLYSNEVTAIGSTTEVVVQKVWVGRFNEYCSLIIVTYSDTALAKVVDFTF